MVTNEGKQVKLVDYLILTLNNIYGSHIHVHNSYLYVVKSL